MSITLSEESTARSLASIKRYMSEALDQEIGDLKARLILEFVLKEIGPSIYNGAIAEAQTFMRDRVADLEAACSHDEFAYWPRSATRGPAR